MVFEFFSSLESGALDLILAALTSHITCAFRIAVLASFLALISAILKPGVLVQLFVGETGLGPRASRSNEMPADVSFLVSHPFGSAELAPLDAWSVFIRFVYCRLSMSSRVSAAVSLGFVPLLLQLSF